MGAFEEFKTRGELGREGIDLVYRTVAAVARLRRFPPPEDHQRWTEDAVFETAHDFLIAGKGLGRLRQIHMQASDDESFERLLHQAVRNHLRSRARATEFGSVMRRVRAVLEADPRFQKVPGGGVGRWTLATSGVPEQFTGQIDTLIQIGREVEGVREVRWRSERRRGPIADSESLARIFEAVLQRAGTSLRVRELAQVTAARFNLVDPPLLHEVDEIGTLSSMPARPGPAEVVAARERALEIWEQLTERERRVYQYLDLSVRDAAQQLGVGKSQVAVAMTRVKDLLATEVGPGEGATAILAELEKMAGAVGYRTVS